MSSARMCWSMCAKKSCSPSPSMGEHSATSTSAIPAMNETSAQTPRRAPAAASPVCARRSRQRQTRTPRGDEREDQRPDRGSTRSPASRATIVAVACSTRGTRPGRLAGVLARGARRCWRRSAAPPACAACGRGLARAGRTSARRAGAGWSGSGPRCAPAAHCRALPPALPGRRGRVRRRVGALSYDGTARRSAALKFARGAPPPTRWPPRSPRARRRAARRRHARPGPRASRAAPARGYDQAEELARALAAAAAGRWRRLRRAGAAARQLGAGARPAASARRWSSASRDARPSAPCSSTTSTRPARRSGPAPRRCGAPRAR